MSDPEIALDRPVRHGWSPVPHLLWEQSLSVYARVMIGFLHSHKPSFLAMLSRNQLAVRISIARTSVDKGLEELERAGALSVLSEPGKRSRIVLHAKWWEDLMTTGPEQSTTGRVASTTGRVASTNRTCGVHVVDHLEDHLENTFAPAVAVAKKPAKPRPRDEVWDALMEVCRWDTERMTASATGQMAKAVQELKAINATPEEIQLKARRYRQTMTGAVLTPGALTKWWSQLNGNTPAVSREPGPVLYRG